VALARTDAAAAGLVAVGAVDFPADSAVAGAAASRAADSVEAHLPATSSA
jgi:hypothetical protein